jgi:plastocyanin
MEAQPQQEGGIIDQLFGLLEQLILPNWPDLILWLPWVLMLIVAGWLLFTALQWRKASERTRPRVPRPLAGGAPPPGVHMPGPSRWPFVVPVGVALVLFSVALPPRADTGAQTAPFDVPLFAIGLLIILIGFGGWLFDAMREWRSTADPEHEVHTALAAGTGGAAAALMPRGGGSLVPVGHAQEIVDAEPVHREPPPGVHMPGPSPWPFFVPIGITVVVYGVLFSGFLLLGGLILTVIAIAGWYLEAGREYRSTEEVGHAVPHTRDPYQAWPHRLVPVFVAVIVLSFAGALAPLGIGYLDSLTPAEATAPPIAVPAVPEIAADNSLSFDTTSLVVPAGRPFELVFANNEAGVPHNVQIEDSPARAQVLFGGEIVTGPTTVTYQVPALQQGEYYFLCAVHPNMDGTVNALPEGGPPPPPGGSGGETPAPQASAPAGPAGP